MHRIFFIVLFLMFINVSFAQDTVKVRRPDDDRYCTLLLCVKKTCYTDSIPKELVSSDQKTELRINDRCNAKKRTDVFVSSFEVWTESNGVIRSETAHSSFFTDPQLKIIRSLEKGQSFEIKNVVVHAPDAFKKMDNIKIIIK
jgi:hypothetical protein